MRTDILRRKEEIVTWIAKNMSKAFICRQLSCKPDTLNSYLTKMGIEYKGNQSGKGIKTGPKYKSALEYSKTLHPSSHKLKLKLIRDGVKEQRCERCGLSEWLDRTIPLELHHVNGNHYDNAFSNLEILCPNCHALEDNNSGAGRKHKGA